jgi:hypothetical protein
MATTTSEALLTKVAFGSCNKQDREQPLWQVISNRVQPALWLWAGDAVYTPVPGTVAQVRAHWGQSRMLVLSYFTFMLIL